MRELQYTITFRCGHDEVNTVKCEGGSIKSRLKIWTLPKNRTSIFVCTHCAATSPRHAPPARGTSQTIQAMALGSQGHSVRALQSVQIRWAEIASLSTSEQVEEFLPDHQDLATEAQRALGRIDNFWRSAHAEHIVGIPSEILGSSERGPDACPLCREYLSSAIEHLRRASDEQDDHFPEDYEIFNRRLVEDAISRKGLDIELEGARLQSSNSPRLPRKSHRHSRRSRSKPTETVQTKLSTIMEERRSRSSSGLSDSSGPQSAKPSLWGHYHKNTGKRSIHHDPSSEIQGLWQSSQAQSSTESMRPFIVESDSSRTPLRKLDGSVNVAEFKASDNSLWQPPEPTPLPKINPDSVEGFVTIQRIRNHLKFPDATPVELWSIRGLPESFTNIDSLLEYARDMLAVGWTQEDEDAAKIIRATKPDPDSFDGKQALQRIRRCLNLRETTSIGDILAISELSNAVINKKDIETLIKDLNLVSWEAKYEAQVKKLQEAVSEAARVSPDPTKLLAQSSPP